MRMNKTVWKIIAYICMFLGLGLFAFAVWLEHDYELWMKVNSWISVDVLFWVGAIMGFGGTVAARRLENVYIDRR